MDCGALDRHDSHLEVAKMSAEEITSAIPTDDLKLIRSMGTTTVGEYFKFWQNLGLHKNKDFYAYGERNELVGRKCGEKLVQQQIRALKVSTVRGKIDDLDGNILEEFPEEKTKKRAREDSESSFPLCVPSPLDRKHILPKMTSLPFDGTPTTKKKRRCLSPPGSLNRASHRPVLSQSQAFTPDRPPLYLNLFTPTREPSLSQASLGELPLSNLKDPKNYE